MVKLKKTLWKDIYKSIYKSKGRFVSIMGLMLLGSFALVGLKVTGPNMRSTGATYFEELNVSDITIISNLGLDENDEETIRKVEGANKIEFGYLKDVVLKDTNTSFRIFSDSKDISAYQLTEGRFPEKEDEIAIVEQYATDFNIGDSIEFSEKEDVNGEKALKRDEFEIVGFIYSGEIISDVNLGASTAGTGALNGYGVVSEEAFDSDFYMLARLTFEDTQNMDPYSDEYTDKIQRHKEDLDHLLKDQPEIRLATIKSDYQKEIDEGQAEIDDAKRKINDTQKQLDDVKKQLENGQQEIDDNEKKLNQQVAEAQVKIDDGTSQIANAKASISDSQQQLFEAKQQLNTGQTTLENKWQQLETAKQQLTTAKSSLTNANTQLQEASSAVYKGHQQIATGYQQIANNQEELAAADKQIKAAAQTIGQKQKEFEKEYQKYKENAQVLERKRKEYEVGLSQIQEAQNELNAQKQNLEEAKKQYETGLNEIQQQINRLEESLENPELPAGEKEEIPKKLSKAQQEMEHLQTEMDIFLKDTYTPGIKEISKKQVVLDTQKQELAKAKQQLDAGEQQLYAAKNQLDSADKQIAEANQQLTVKKEELHAGQEQLSIAKEILREKENVLQEKEKEYQIGLEEYNSGIANYNQNMNQYYAGLEQWQQGAETLSAKSGEYQKNIKKIEEAQNELSKKQDELAFAKDELAVKKAAGETKLAEARQTLADKEEEYNGKTQKFHDEKPDVEREIEENKNTLDEAQEILDHLSAPVYSLNSRREIPGGDGYKIYSTITWIVDAIGNVFPIFLYFVAALVTFTTMTRFVDEERINSGTLKALGYDNQDVMKKFVFYGLISGLSGAIMGIILGHTLLPLIVYNAYHSGFTLPKIEFHFHLGITLVALLLAVVSSVLPAWLVASKEYKQMPAKLLVPKAPSAGSKILLEYITPIWDRMSFTHKVTARNIFRYKKRMLMTIFGVAGSVSLLFAGLSVQYSLSGINERQFGELIRYDAIVAKNEYVTDDQQDEIDELLRSPDVTQFEMIHYEEMTKVAGDNKDTQEIKLIVPDHPENFSDYVNLINRETGDKISFPNDGVIISERLAQLLEVDTNDTIILKDSKNKSQEMKVKAITEMYMGHFAFTSEEGYQTIFGEEPTDNAYMVNLKDKSLKNTEKQAAKFIDLSGVQGVVQNTTLTTQISTIVDSLDQIMTVLIIVAVLLGIVILYNLTNINVSERIRELSTIKVLGFYDEEVTMYIYRETILLTLFGILTGFGIGKWLHQYIITVVPPEDVMFNPALSASSFIIPTVVILFVTVVLGFVINHRLKNVDMLEALKSVD